LRERYLFLGGLIVFGYEVRDEIVPWLVYGQGVCALGPLAGLFDFWGAVSVG
jgi:hypothetical protein